MEKGLQWTCQGSGKCCVSRGEYGFVYLDLKDRQRFAKYLKISTQKFTSQYCHKTDDGYFHLKQHKNETECIFLKNNKCGVYQARPTQCRTWPFWPEVLNAKAWKNEVAKFCPGVGKGKTWSAKEVEAIKNQQIRSEKRM